MTQKTETMITYQSGEEKIFLSMESLQKMIREGDPENRNFRVYQVNKHNQMCLVLERADGLEKRYNPKFGYLIYQFMIGRENKFLHGKMYFPGQVRSPIILESKDAHTVEKMRFGRIYENKNIMVEYY